MKTATIPSILVLLVILCPLFSKCQKAENSNSHSGFLWGEINGGYSTNGAAGSLAMNYKTGKILFGAYYYQSHICYEGSKKHDYFLTDEASDQHFNIQSVAVLSGIVFPGKSNPSLSIGVSLTRFKYVSTTCIEHNVTLPRIWETIMNRDYINESISTSTIHSVGIPVEFKLHFAPKHFAGFDAGIKADVNMNCSFISAEVGIRLGRIIRKQSFVNF